MVALSSDGSYLVAGADATYVFQRQNGVFVEILKQNCTIATDIVVAVAISDKGDWIVSGTGSGWVYLVPNKVAAGPAAAIPWQAPNNQYIKSVAMAADGSAFAVLATDRTVCNVYFFSLDSSNAATYFPGMPHPDAAWNKPLVGCNFGGLSVATNGSVVSAVGNVQAPDLTVTGSVSLWGPHFGRTPHITGRTAPQWTRRGGI
jgi:hypothetical protein